ncbi:hypothetical protein [Catenuloplanes japonicus]|uniref:hypothetical protein n=1 Tax=Catenuloplanes japonicus TaxID=33876 RepID=UPI000524E7A2|nr:hypothetical protein [Catenuloplanes japonicus]
MGQLVAQFNQQFQTAINQNNADIQFLGTGGADPGQLIEALILRLQRDAPQEAVASGVIPVLESARAAAGRGSHGKMKAYLARAAELAAPTEMIAAAVAAVVRAVESV